MKNYFSKKVLPQIASKSYDQKLKTCLEKHLYGYKYWDRTELVSSPPSFPNFSVGNEHLMIFKVNLGVKGAFSH